MRRLARADSPEVVRVSEASPESSFRELDDVFLQTQARIWLGEVLHIRFDEETPIADLLADGELLFQVSIVVWKMLLKKHVKLKSSKIFIYERTSFAKHDGKYMPYPKVDSFLKICQILELTGVDLFSPSDVVEKRDTRRVCMCIRSLSKKARLKNLSVPDFDVVTYTIAMPTDLVGGIRRSLEQSRCSSSSSGSYSMDFRRLYRQKGYSGQHDQSHEYCSESDEAESSFNGLELESPSSNVSYDSSNMFNLDGEVFAQGSLGDDSSSKLHGYFELEGQTHGENGHKSEHYGKDESAMPCSVDKEQGLQPLEWSGFGKQDQNAVIKCFQKCFLSCAELPYEAEIPSYMDSVPENCSPKSSMSDTLISTADGNEESECMIQHEEDLDGSPVYMFQSHDGKSRCKGLTHHLDENDENQPHLAYNKIEGTEQNSVHVNLKTNGANSIDGYAMPEYSFENGWASSDVTCQNIHNADIVLLDSELPGALSCLFVGNDDSQGKDSSVHEMRTADQVIDCGQCFLPTSELVPDEAAKVSNNDNFQHDNHSAGNFLFLDDLCMSTSGESSEQTLNVEERNIGPIHSSLPTDMFSVHDAACACLQHMDKSIPNTAYKNSVHMKNDIVGRSCVNNLDPYYRNETSEMVTGGAIVTTDSKLSCSHCSKDLPDMEYMFADNAAEGKSDKSYFSGTLSTLGPACHSSTVHTGAPAEFDDDCTRDQASFACSNHEILAEAIGDITAGMNSEVRYQAHLIDDVGTSMNRMVPDVDEERKKDMEDVENNVPSTMTISGNGKEETVVKIRSPGKKVLKSIAGSVTLIGALLVFLHMRRKSDKEKNHHTVTPLRTKETCQKVDTHNTVEVGKSDKKYPGERLKL
ncbi:hypothetical protein MUK42_23588 [Musa troglodytarum]|uniref:Calponin-homology (CH) domain-containing protein n=1 Tax=Musa troglodytarum TaxID=320322 RepID=A0A9E7G5X7_9LILI|nr:hypothetical protein MUK42_23588 [Musa troglodytarum]